MLSNRIWRNHFKFSRKTKMQVTWWNILRIKHWPLSKSINKAIMKPILIFTIFKFFFKKWWRLRKVFSTFKYSVFLIFILLESQILTCEYLFRPVNFMTSPVHLTSVWNNCPPDHLRRITFGRDKHICFYERPTGRGDFYFE